ncbi:alpha-hydroxy acid oxidase [Paraburkholderia heleia]|uniref:alpha-hydroxy acid oxidase n=1 Tax=Paraburkholderia heleia TaxID=634127 RepID=UPI0031D40651
MANGAINRRLAGALSIGDLRKLAQRALPRVLFDYVEGGPDDERGIEHNRDVFNHWALVPRYMQDVSYRSTATSILDTRHSAPFGVGPTGFAGLLRPGADLMLARAANEAGLPFVLSGVSNATLESVAAEIGEALWFQLYPSRDRRISDDMVRRAESAGVTHLVVTVDLPVTSNRERDARNGFGFPPALKPSGYLEAMTHPAWCLRYLTSGGAPVFANWTEYASEDSSASDVARLIKSNSPAMFTWTDVRRLRDSWPHKLIVKGILHLDDALNAQRHGVDALIISNHGGRQLDRAIASINALPLIRREVGDDFPLMIDGGVRRGSDIAIALCLGANFVFVGRPTLYGVAAAGEAGAGRAIQILRTEFDRVMGQLGATRPEILDTSFLADGYCAAGSLRNA